MAHTFRFIGEQAEAGAWRLSGDEAHHVSKVLRLTEGTQVEVTDGRGTWSSGVITALSGKEVTIAAAGLHREEAPQLRLELALGALKPAAIDEVLPMLCELGVDAIHVFGQMGVTKTRLGPKVQERWQRIVSQSIKQCKRAWLPTIHEHASVAALLTATSCIPARIFLRGADDPGLLQQLPAAAPVILAVVGGEKGLDPHEEAALLDAGLAPASLGRWVLRAVTAAVAATASLSLHRDQL